MHRPCDVYAAGGTPCVAAHSMIRPLYASYSGPLYRVERSSDRATKDIGVAASLKAGAGPASGGVIADGAAQDAFCAGSTCRVQRIFDQSGNGNHLDVGAPLPPRNNCSDVGNHSYCPGCEPLPPPPTCDIGTFHAHRPRPRLSLAVQCTPKTEQGFSTQFG